MHLYCKYLNFCSAFYWCQAVGQEAEAGTQEGPPEHEEELPYCSSDRALEQVTQGGCGIFSGNSKAIWTQSTCSRLTLPEQGGWTRSPTVVLSNLTHSVILLLSVILKCLDKLA